MTTQVNIWMIAVLFLVVAGARLLFLNGTVSSDHPNQINKAESSFHEDSESSLPVVIQMTSVANPQDETTQITDDVAVTTTDDGQEPVSAPVVEPVSESLPESESGPDIKEDIQSAPTN